MELIRNTLLSIIFLPFITVFLLGVGVLLWLISGVIMELMYVLLGMSLLIGLIAIGFSYGGNTISRTTAVRNGQGGVNNSRDHARERSY